MKKFIKAKFKDIRATKCHGYMDIPFRDLVRILGKPNDRTKENEWKSADKRIRFEWAFKSTQRERPTVITIYDYQQTKLPIDEVSSWLLGSKGNLDDVWEFFRQRFGDEGFDRWKITILEP